MLKPTKHTNLKYSILNISWNIVSILKDNEILTYSELLGILSIKIWKNVKEITIYGLSFLYSLWTIEYLKELDAFKLK